MPLAGAVADARTTALALAAAALAAACFIGMDSTAKLLVERYGTTQVTFLRFATGALFAVRRQSAVAAHRVAMTGSLAVFARQVLRH